MSSFNISEKGDYNCKGQLLSRSLQQLVYSTCLAELSGQSLKSKDWKVQFGPWPGDFSFSPPYNNSDKRHTRLTSPLTSHHNETLTHTFKAKFHVAWCFCCVLTDSWIAFIFHKLAQLENHSTLKKRHRTLWYIRFKSGTCVTRNKTNIKNNDGIFPSLSVMWMMFPFLTVGVWTKHMQYVHTTHTKWLI